MCLFLGLKVFSEENLVKYRARKSQKRKTNCGCELRNSNLSRKSLTTKNAKQIVALSYAQLESKPQIKTTITGVQRNVQT